MEQNNRAIFYKMNKSPSIDIFYVYAVMIGMLNYVNAVAREHHLKDIGAACDAAQTAIGKEKNEVKSIHFSYKSSGLPTNINIAAKCTVEAIKKYLKKGKGNMNDKEACDYVLTSTSVWLKHALDGIDENMVAPKVNAVCEEIVPKLGVVKPTDPNYKDYSYKGYIALNIFYHQRQQLYN